MSNICTSIAQSKKLIELGLNINTADMYYFQQIDSDYFPPDKEWYCGPFVKGIKENNDFNPKYDVASWSLSTLLELIPIAIICEDKRYSLQISKFLDFNKNKVIYELGYNGYGWLIFKQSDNPIDTTFKIVCWLLENNHINNNIILT